MVDQANEGLLSPFLRDQRIQAAAPHLRGRVLDIGCGDGSLASHCAPKDYVGSDLSPAALAAARRNHPRHTFIEGLPDRDEDPGFDTIVGLAVIEHVPDPAGFLAMLAEHLRPGGVMVMTTPHPRVDFVHTFGASVGLFSQHASDEHEELLDLLKMSRVAARAGLEVKHFRRFLFGANQLFVLEPVRR